MYLVVDYVFGPWMHCWRSVDQADGAMAGSDSLSSRCLGGRPDPCIYSCEKESLSRCISRQLPFLSKWHGYGRWSWKCPEGQESP